ncbi:MAG: FkbM family methyltransferase [Lachnospiraceae bacterium]|nr:FkbM family methyltransferase [Lachnospiraceae bacterium]
MTFTDMRKIYTHFQDGISRKLFTARLNVSATGDAGYITMLPAEYRNLNADIENFRAELLSEDRKRTVIFGAGFNGVSIAREMHMESLVGFIDNYRSGQIENMTGMPIFSVDHYIGQYGIKHTKFVISVSDREAAGEIYAQLTTEGVDADSILVIPAEYRNNTSQYFDLFTPDEHEVFVDCGCFDASTAFHFAGWCGRKGYDKIWCFEPDKSSYEICKSLCAGWRDCVVYPYGVSEQSGTVLFESGKKEESRIVKQVGQERCDAIETVALDEFLRGERVTFIKMDIEGAEIDALKGAAQIIRDQKPKLAISIYHRAEDIIEIPKLILDLRPDYKLYLRHYSLLSNETVLYAC